MRTMLRQCFLIAGLGLMTSSCATFALSYQNYFTKNFAYVASKYTGDPTKRMDDGAESNNFDDGNQASYSAAEYPSLLFGFRSLEHHNSQYTSGNQMDETIIAAYIPPQKSEADAVAFLTLEMSGKNINAKPAIPQVTGITFMKQTYPALYATIDTKSLLAASGSGQYTIIWKSVKGDGKVENRELSRVVTTIVP